MSKKITSWDVIQAMSEANQKVWLAPLSNVTSVQSHKKHGIITIGVPLEMSNEMLIPKKGNNGGFLLIDSEQFNAMEKKLKEKKETDIEILLNEISEFNEVIPNFEKIEGDPLPMCKVKIWWIDRDFPDDGYCFALPHQKIDEADLCVHIPSPDNSDGIGEAPPIFTTICSISNNKRVKRLVCVGGFR